MDRQERIVNRMPILEKTGADHYTQQEVVDLNELRYSFYIGVSYAFSVSFCGSIRHVVISRDLFPKTWMIILDECLP